ncbi:MAG TPA: SAM-dependent methyltransferase [Afifellaceae bacterium]|nr:SAM-dependent methyltransferase [Afifellaceae bacterium]
MSDRNDIEANNIRPGEIALPFDPAGRKPDAGVIFIGRAQTPWTRRSGCPRNMGQARERGKPAVITIDADWRAGLAGLAAGDWIQVLVWADKARRDLIVQSPKHRNEPVGVFALRSPVRPNPILLSLTRISAIDRDAGKIEVDALDSLDGSPVIDIKPFISSADQPVAEANGT